MLGFKGGGVDGARQSEQTLPEQEVEAGVFGVFILNQTSEADEPISDAPDPTDAWLLLKGSPSPGSSPLFLGSRITGEPVMSCRELQNTPTVRPRGGGG